MGSITVSRRDFLKLLGLTAGSLLITSCGAGAGAAANQVRIMVHSWGLAYAPFKEMAKKYNALHPETPVSIEASPGGWETKVLGQIRSNKLQWSAAGVMTSFNDLAAWVQLGLIQPIDALIASSQEAGAKTFLSDMLPPVKEDNSYESQMYGIPFSIENISYLWNTELFTKAGITQAPKTWQELYDYSKAIKDYLASQGNTDTYAFCFDLGNLSRNLGTLMCSISDHPYTSEGLLDWESDEMRESLRFMRKLSRDGLTPPNCGEGLEIIDMWTRGRVAGLYSCSSRSVWAQKVIGFDKVSTASVPTMDGQSHAGTVFWSNSVAILNSTSMPQQALDFLIYAVGPQNLEWQTAIVQAGTSPAFASVYAKTIEKDAAFEPYRWMSGLSKDVALSAPAPKNFYYQVQNEAWNRHRSEYLDDKSTMTEDELIQKILKSTEEIIEGVLKSVPTAIP